MNPVPFVTPLDCTACALRSSATHPGVPARPLSASGNPTALLVVGEAPGYQEDLQFKCWVGQSGSLLQSFLSASDLPSLCDIYLSNACRCRPPARVTPTAGHITRCRPNLQSDLSILSLSYSSIVILCCGASAVKSVCGSGTTMSDLFRCQGRPLSHYPKGISLSLDSSPAVFATYHPAALLPGRSPSLVHSVADHFSCLRRFLSGSYSPSAVTAKPLVHAPVPSPDSIPSLVCLDIETYGMIAGLEQTVFHPTKSLYVDVVPFKDQIQTVSFGYIVPGQHPDGLPFTYPDSSVPAGTLMTFCYTWPDDLAAIRHWFLILCSRPNQTLIGQNICYDLLYLKASDPVLYNLLQPGTLHLDDTLILSFLWNEARPEKSLKALASLLGLADYSTLSVSPLSAQANSRFDSNLHYYNCLDVAVTLSLYHLSLHEIALKYGPSSPKLSSTCSYLRDLLLWGTLELESNGFTLDPRLLRVRESKLYSTIAGDYAVCEHSGITVSGTGSDLSTRTFLTTALEQSGLLSDPNVQLTDKKKQVSVGADNINLLLSRLPLDSPYITPLQAMLSHASAEKELTSYVGKLLSNTRRGITYYTPSVGYCYPTWFPIPMSFDESTTNRKSKMEGGTKQARYSCKNPAAQTFPPSVMSCLCSRFPTGRVVAYDLSQIELRIAALLSGDPVMLMEYQRNIDRHAETARFVFPHIPLDHPDFRKLYRQGGKTLNFLVLYMGGPGKFQETVLKDLGILLDWDVCNDAINQFNRKYPVFRAWQNDLICSVKRLGYLELITGWSRCYSTGNAAEEYVTEIVNQPVQTIAAQYGQSAQHAIRLEMKRLHMRSLEVLQIHDGFFYDVPSAAEEKILDSLAEKYLTRAPLLSILESSLGRTVPILYEKKVVTDYRTGA